MEIDKSSQTATSQFQHFSHIGNKKLKQILHLQPQTIYKNEILFC